MNIATGLFLLMSLAAADPPKLERFEATQRHMGVAFRIVLYAADESSAQRAFDAAFARIEQLDRIMSDYDAESELSKLSRQSPTTAPVTASDDLWNVLVAAQQFSQQTDGAFDITVGPLTQLWRRARRLRELPPADELAAARAATGFRNLQLDGRTHTVSLLQAKMRLDLGGIAKGYAADQALAALRSLGVQHALVDGSGDMALGDAPPDKPGWRIGVAPLKPSDPPSRYLTLANCAIATSGDAWQFVELAGQRYSHIVDPRTGLGLTDRSSVTIVAPNCTTADALASAVSVLGSDAGLALAEETAGVAALIVRAPAGEVETHISKRFVELGGELESIKSEYLTPIQIQNPK